MSSDKIKPTLRTATVTSLIKVTDKVYVARLALPEGAPMSFDAGQYGSFLVGGNQRRNFSFTTKPSANFFEICADITPMGPGSTWLINLKRGENVQFLGPLGRFVVDYDSPKQRIFIATGTGIAPIRSMLYESLQKDPKTKTRLYFGLRFQEDIFWDEEFRVLTNTYSSFDYHLSLSQPNTSWTGKKGRVTDNVFDDNALEQCDFYLCGNRQMIRDMTDRLLESKIHEIQIKTELFY